MSHIFAGMFFLLFGHPFNQFFLEQISTALKVFFTIHATKLYPPYLRPNRPKYTRNALRMLPPCFDGNGCTCFTLRTAETRHGLWRTLFRFSLLLIRFLICKHNSKIKHIFELVWFLIKKMAFGRCHR